jgi:thioredoxin reductase (NADPH)
VGAGIYYGAGSSEAELCGDDDVYIVGGGNSAGQAVLHFSRFARKVTMVIRGSGLKETLSQYLIDRITASPKVEVLNHTEVTGLAGDSMLRSITLTNRQTNETRTVPTSSLFLCLGGVPHTEWADQVGVVRDEQGYLVTGIDLQAFPGFKERWPLDRQPFYLETSVPGVFAAGDVRHGSMKRCASAVGEGAMAVAFVHRYLSNRG